jgi:hypothetical protein
METAIRNQVDNLNQGVQEFIKCIDSLPESLFLKKIDDWTPRDVAAHLIGWNLYTIKGCQQLTKGELPFYLVDPGDDFCKINALLVKIHNSQDKKKIIKQLIASSEKLEKFLSAVTPRNWDADFGIIYKGEVIIIKNCVDELIADFISHRQQIEKWAQKTD